MSNIIYNPYVFTNKISGNTNTYTGSSPYIDPDISISKGCTFNLAYFDKHIITKNDIIGSLINYIDDNTDKFFFKTLIIDTNYVYNEIVLTGLCCVKLYYNDIFDYFLMNVINEPLEYNSVILYEYYTLINEEITTTTTTVIKTPLIYYKYASDETWYGGGLIVPNNVSLYLIHDEYTGWTLNQLSDLFLDYIYDYYEQNVDISKVNVKIYQTGSSISQNEILYAGEYDVVFSYTDLYDNSNTNTISKINVIQKSSNIIYNSNILSDNISGYTNTYTGVTNQILPDILISSGFTFNLNVFDNNIITKYDIINSLINYIENDVDKFLLNMLIVDNNHVYEQITTTGTCCIKIYYNDIVEYLLINIINDITKNDIIYYKDFNLINFDTTTTTSTTIKTLIIYYNYSIENIWSGGGAIVPYDVSLHLIHNGITGWTINQLRDLFIDHVYNYYEHNVDINKIDVELYKDGSSILESNIYSAGVYSIVFSYIDLFGNSITNTISEINVIQNSPTIHYKEYILSSRLTGNTNDYTGVTNQILPDIAISSGFTFNLSGFDNNVITKDDIIQYLIEYVRGDNCEIIDKYSVNIVIAKGTIYRPQNIYETVDNPGIFCVEVLKENIFGDKTIKYFIMKVVSNVSVYSEGYWQDNKVWVDSVVWLDHQIFGNR